MGRADITALILCGGAGSRLGGADKGLVAFHGRPLVDLAIGKCQTIANAILISANRNIAQYESRGVPVLRDAHYQDDGPHFDGPLAGIRSGLAASRTDWLLTVPCDAPLFPQDLVDRFTSHAEGTENGWFVAGHPTFSLLPVRHLKSLELFLQRGQRKLQDWLAAQGVLAVAFDDSLAFKNLNTPSDF